MFCMFLYVFNIFCCCLIFLFFFVFLYFFCILYFYNNVFMFYVFMFYVFLWPHKKKKREKTQWWVLASRNIRERTHSRHSRQAGTVTFQPLTPNSLPLSGNQNNFTRAQSAQAIVWLQKEKKRKAPEIRTSKSQHHPSESSSKRGNASNVYEEAQHAKAKGVKQQAERKASRSDEAKRKQKARQEDRW